MNSSQSFKLVQDVYNSRKHLWEMLEDRGYNVEHLKKHIGQTFYRKREAPKHRYLYFLGSSRENKKMRLQLKHDCKAYPKNKEEFLPPIEKYEVENTNKNKSMEKFIWFSDY